MFIDFLPITNMQKIIKPIKYNQSDIIQPIRYNIVCHKVIIPPQKLKVESIPQVKVHIIYQLISTYIPVCGWIKETARVDI